MTMPNRDNHTEAERLALTRRATVLKGEIRERIAELEHVERRLAEIDTGEQCLNGHANQ
jgi:hypothetical protein